MENWQELAQSVVIGLIFSYLVAKLISIVLHFKDDNLRLARAGDPPEDPPEDVLEDVPEEPQKGAGLGVPDPPPEEEGEDDDEDEDWEGVESTELDEAFSAATAFVAAIAVDGRGKVGSEVQLQLYGLYKICH